MVSYLANPYYLACDSYKLSDPSYRIASHSSRFSSSYHYQLTGLRVPRCPSRHAFRYLSESECLLTLQMLSVFRLCFECLDPLEPARTARLEKAHR
ncbi:hypothetical protein M404DRAFT_323974 [Pisolithus tinctorius Marx 270]|uniref:Uncharacterized protein n=1 Tax=Pisolithus tinctorius Marx 270 TaxID=870435 RepID=A0A0C3PJD5_PISTI|nr:hypothetical protein M404DRAFT_323974 [Pisolithus tinctorius Marx 270]